MFPTFQSLHLNPLKRKHLGSIGAALLAMLNLGVTLRLAIGHLDVVLEQEAGEDHFDFVCGEEAAGTGVSAVAKGEVGFVCRDKLVAGNVLGLAARTLLVRAVAVEAVGGWVKGFVAVDGR